MLTPPLPSTVAGKGRSQQGGGDIAPFHDVMKICPAEMMEKLQKREKEVSALTSQVEGLKSQLAGRR